MNVIFNKQRDYIYQAQFDLACDQKTLQDDLAKELWVANKNGYGQLGFSYRYNVKEIKSLTVKKVVDYFYSDSFNHAIIDTLYAETYFPGLWGIDSKRLSNITVTFGTLVLDKPGYSSQIHLDNRLLVASGMCYFIDADDENQSTYFYSDKNKNNCLRMPTGFATGWLAANTHDSCHEGYNKSIIDRYNILYGLAFAASIAT